MKENLKQPVVRNYKDTLFRKLFSDKENLLSLYNLVASQHYTDPDLLSIVTLNNAIYMNMKNDLAFLIDSFICMYEHQSTLSPNLPLRYMYYVSREYEKLTSNDTIYSSKRIYVPAPDFVVFYNGNCTDWTVRYSKLSESFLPVQKTPNLELVVKEININLGTNDKLFMQCKPLYEYMQYIDKVRTYAAYMPIPQAIDMAVKESIKEGILSEFLLKNRSEAIQMSIFEFDEEREMKLIRADEREIGREEGRERTMLSNVIATIKYDLSQNIAEESIIQRIIAIFGLQYQEVKQIMQMQREN